MHDRRYVQDLTIQELEEVLMLRRRDERLARLRRMKQGGRLSKTVIVPDSDELFAAPAPPDTAAVEKRQRFYTTQGIAEDTQTERKPRTWQERILLGIEIAALVALIGVIASLAINVRSLNRDWKAQHSSDAYPTPTATPLIRVAILPGGHEPPTTRGGEAQPLGPVTKLTIPTPSSGSPTRLIIPSLNVDVPVVEGDGWEQLKQGAGHHIGSANPGERGNCFISGHNDIYGEIFRDLEELKIGDEILVYGGEQLYRYVVRATRIVEPDDVSVMYPTSTPVLTLMTCYPYMIDSQRLVVISELDR